SSSPHLVAARRAAPRATGSTETRALQHHREAGSSSASRSDGTAAGRKRPVILPVEAVSTAAIYRAMSRWNAMRTSSNLRTAFFSTLISIAAGSTAGVYAQPPRTAPVVAPADFEQMMTDLSNWGRWGREDELGTLNLITPEVRRRATELVREGVSVSMSFNPSTEPAIDNTAPLELAVNRVANGAVILDTWKVAHHGFTFTHIDALCHWFLDGRMYNGFEASTVTTAGCEKAGVQVMKNGIVARGVIVDIPRMRNLPYL